MKTKIFLFLIVICVVFASCDLNGSNDNTPEIGVSVIANNTDTLYASATDEGGVYKLDTIYVGDTILFKLGLNAFYNNITSFYLTQPDTVSAKILFPTVASIDTIISMTSSNISKGHFEFLKGQNFVYFPVRYIPKQPSSTAYLDFYLSSDAKFENSIGYNSFSFRLLTPIVAKPDSID